MLIPKHAGSEEDMRKCLMKEVNVQLTVRVLMNVHKHTPQWGTAVLPASVSFRAQTDDCLQTNTERFCQERLMKDV